MLRRIPILVVPLLCLLAAACKNDDTAPVCEAGTQGCACLADGTCTTPGMICEEGVCVSGTDIPEDPKCYSPCRQGMTLADGTRVACSAQGLMEGCLGGTVCQNGSCMPAGGAAAGCTSDSGCPDFQTCIAGACYSTCEQDADCNDGWLCHRHVCRLACNTVDAPCLGADRVCVPHDGENGFCMPSEPAGDESQTRVEGTFLTTARRIEFSNIRPETSFYLINDHPAPQDFVISKLRHTGYTEDGIVTVTRDDGAPLFWLEMGTPGELAKVSSFTVHVEPFSEVQLQIAAAGDVDDEELQYRWEGALEISNHQMGKREVLLRFASKPEGQWTGNMIYFASFRDVGVEEWMAGGDISGLQNAFLVFWDEFKNGQRSLDQFLAMLTSTIDETWKYPWVEEYGNCSLAENACFPDDSAEGYGVYTQDLVHKPIPTGAVEFPIALNLMQDTGPEALAGRVVTGETLHYAGDPEVTLRFSQDPDTAQANRKGVVICPLEAFSTRVLVGGRFLLPEPGDDELCPAYAEGTYDVTKTPWLVPGFEKGTAVEDGQLYRYECRDTRLPLGDPAGDMGLTALNQSYAGSNPIPDGHTRERVVTLVDGALVNGKELFIIFKEHFASFMGAAEEDEEGFAAYGLMRLERSTAKLEPADFEGNQVAEDRTFVNKLPAVGCSQEVLDTIEAATGTRFDPDASADVPSLATTLLLGSPDLGNAPEITDTSEEEVHWFCEDTGLIDGQVQASGLGYSVPCAEDSRVVYFTLKKINPAAADIGDMIDWLSCDDEFEAGTIETDIQIGTDADGYTGAQDAYHNTVMVDVITKGACWDTVQGWLRDTERYELGGPMPDYAIRMDPVWRCEDLDRVYCSDDRLDLRAGKVFFEEAPTGGVAFINAYAAVDDAFRYKTRFRSRTGKTVGFAPSICVPSSAAIPYCYDPAGIEDLTGRIDCLTYLYANHADVLEQDPALMQDVIKFLRTTFAYDMITLDPDGNLLEVPVIHEGFERLFSELLIMMGDEAYTNAFASRFDLAGSSIRSFEGSLFEPPDGINLSGGAGYEMYTLYQAAQYYQLALDRFYKLSPLIWQTLSSGTVDTSFITQETVTAYFDRLIRASTQKSRAWSEVAKRYADFNRADLARRVVARAYTATYLESVVLSRMMLKMERVVDLADWPQISERVEMAQLGYRSALRKMREVYASISDRKTVFGYAPEYVPFPAMDPLDTNAFEKTLAMAKESLAAAAEKEEVALATRRSFDTEAEAFQSELVTIRNNYEDRLGELCGTFTGEDGRVYPAVPKYAEMHERLRYFPKDPCGFVGNGEIHQAMGEVDIAGLALTRARMDLDDKITEIRIEKERVETMCDLIEDTAQYMFDTQGEIITLQENIEAAKNIQAAAERAEHIAEVYADLGECSPMDGECATAAVSAATLGAVYAVTSTVVTGARMGISIREIQIDKMEQAQSKWMMERECDYALVDSDARVRTMALDLGSLHVELLKAVVQFELASARVVQLANEAERLRDEQAEVEQLAINVAAARNDPNSRIYKNDAILTADRTFETALRAAYKATKVYEYYTSQSYAPLADLFLVRMVAHGDITLEAYLSELESNFIAFEEQYGNPDLRVAVISLKNDIFDIERYDDDYRALTDGERTARMRERLTDEALLDARGYVVVPFSTNQKDLCPLTRNHKIHYVEAQLLGADLGDSVARVYLSPRGTGTVLGVDGEKSFYRFPDRTAVLNAIVGEQRVFSGNVFDGDVYRNRRLRDMPLLNTNWELVVNQRDEQANQDVDLQSLDDILLYVYYTDFTELE